MTPVVITAKQVAEATLKAHAEGRLAAQSPDPRCVYRREIEGKTYVCAVGAAMPDELAAEIQRRGMNTQTVRSLPKDLVSFDGLVSVSRLQRLHDSWASTPKEGASEANLVFACQEVLAR